MGGSSSSTQQVQQTTQQSTTNAQHYTTINVSGQNSGGANQPVGGPELHFATQAIADAATAGGGVLIWIIIILIFTAIIFKKG